MVINRPLLKKNKVNIKKAHIEMIENGLLKDRFKDAELVGPIVGANLPFGSINLPLESLTSVQICVLHTFILQLFIQLTSFSVSSFKSTFTKGG